MWRLAIVFRAAGRSVCSGGGSESMAKGKFFYAVRKGFKPGVYGTWDECKTQVDKFPSAAYKKFASEKDAWAFVRGVQSGAGAASASGSGALGDTACDYSLLPRRCPEPEHCFPLGKKRCQSQQEAEPHPKRAKQTEMSDGYTYMGDAVVVYTDGCCSYNGKKGARAGIGVYWGPNHPLNVSDRLRGRQTNQRAEIQAACRALQQARDNNIKKLVLYTDSKFTINGATSWVQNWKVNGWRLKSGGPVCNKDDFMKLDGLNQELDVVWMHIPGHAGFRGNEEADRLSREGAAQVLPRDQDQDQSP
ncbi:ribonuclease H1 isoform X2 [Synchiropus splendidus]|uniref:ribonuclease H1 isoform X2 n=1 Tax=Synchiropus splendidus TaxID=270530 RepID=UPI00237D332D|nr:ribonuclease H1 isoform X2 [Synchiropus splendidus]